MVLTVRKSFVLIAFLLIARLVANYFLPVYDPSEARYACVCANMARSGNFLEPQFVNDGVLETFEGKPPLYFQMGAICCKIFGINEFALRIPAMASAIAILLMVFFTVRKLRDEATAVFAVLLMVIAPVFLAFAGFCMTDLLLAATICGAVCSYMLFLAEVQKKQKKLYSLGFFAAMGLGMIVKGPVALVMAGLPIFFFTLINKRWGDLKDHAWIGGIGLFLLIAAPWYILMQRKNPDFLEYFFINENFKRFLFKEYGDRYGAGRESFRGMAVVYALACNLPAWTSAFFIAKKSWKKFLNVFSDPLAGMALLWLIGNVLFWSLTSRVLITYLLPTIPAAAIAVADGFYRSGQLADPRFRKRLGATLFAVAICLALVTLATPWAMPKMRDNAGHFFAKIATQYEGKQFYFMRRTPHSAEFYMKGRVFHHPDELRQESVLRSKKFILLTTERDLKKYGTPPNRKVIDRDGVWRVLAPEAE